MSQIQKWLHVYKMVKPDIDKFVVMNPTKLRNIMNLKKLALVPAFQKTINKITNKKHHLLEQETGRDMSRRAVLARIRKWFLQDFYLSRHPVIRPSRAFLSEARIFFSSPENASEIFYGYKHIAPPIDRDYHFYVVKTRKVSSSIPNYTSHTLYLVVLCGPETVDVQTL
jgi:hypothetical protein